MLGHTRLAINDLSDGGHQPLHSPDGTVHAVVIGELYDYEEIKAKLAEEFNYAFSGNSDSEIVIALYQAYGMDFLHHLRGEFVVCLYDETKDVFIAARDRYGVKPLFYTESKGRLLLAAEMKAFLPLDWQPEWDVQSIVEAGWNFDDRTLFRNVRKLRPGHYMVCNASGQIKDQTYWDIEYPDKRILDDRSEEDIVEEVRKRLLDAVRIRLRADVPIGVYLSGGIDSSVVAGLVTHLAKEQGRAVGSQPAEERISCFCVAFDKTSGFDESDIAERTAEWLGVKIHKQIMDEEGFASRFEDATWHCEHHMFDLNYVGKFALSEVPREHGFKVVLTGEGADETFTGYNLFFPDLLREADLTWKDAISEQERVHLSERSEAETTKYLKSIGAVNFDKGVPHGRSKMNNIRTATSMSAFNPAVFADWTSDLRPRHSEDVIADDIPAPVLEKMQQEWHPLNTAQYVFTKDHLANILLSSLGDREEMAHSIEGRTPFLDHHLTEYVNSIPPSLRMKWKGYAPAPSDMESNLESEFASKWVLREAMKPFVTKELYERVKHPYTAHLQYESGGPLHTLLSSLITEENIRDLGFVSWDKVKNLLKRGFEEKELAAARLSFIVAQWVVLAKRFGVKTAQPLR